MNVNCKIRGHNLTGYNKINSNQRNLLCKRCKSWISIDDDNRNNTIMKKLWSKIKKVFSSSTSSVDSIKISDAKMENQAHDNTTNRPKDMYFFDKDTKTICGKFSDSRDGRVYSFREFNGRLWMTENLNFTTENSWWYHNDPEMGKLYGRLYTFDAALKACPSGWHIPSDKEWKGLVDLYGGHLINNGSVGGFINEGIMANTAMIVGGTSGFNAILGGRRSPFTRASNEFDYLNSEGSFWSNSMYDTNGKYDIQVRCVYRFGGSGSNELIKLLWPHQIFRA